MQQQKDFNRHLLTAKHKMFTNVYKCLQMFTNKTQMFTNKTPNKPQTIFM